MGVAWREKGGQLLFWLCATWLMPVFAQESGEVELRAALKARIQAVRADSALLAGAIRDGRETAAFCALCHGHDGNSIKTLIPNLAGQNPVYLLDQIERFADGRRKDFIMAPLAKQLSVGDKVKLATYYSSVESRPIRTGATNAALADKGRTFYQQRCHVCHGADGKGSEGYAYLAGQHPEYIKLTLRHFRDQTGERNNPVMAAQMRGLSDADIDALTEYVANLR